MTSITQPGIFGYYKSFWREFEIAISNGQYRSSSKAESEKMMKLSRNLNQIASRFIHRRDYSTLKPLLKEKHEFVIVTTLTQPQKTMYQV